MQAYQSAPCPYCGITWNPPGAQACANCRNALPAPPPSYAPPGYAPGQAPPAPYPGAPAEGYPGQGQAYPPQSYPQPGQGQPPGPYAYPYPGQPAYPGADQYAGQAPYPGAPPYPYGYPAAAAPAAAPNAVTLFGRTVALPFAPAALLAVVGRMQGAGRKVAVIAVAALVVLLLAFAVLPTLAANQIAGARRAVVAAVAHQRSVDAAMALFLKPASAPAGNTAAEMAALDKELTQVQAALTAIQADEASLQGFDQRLGWLSIVALPSRAAIADERTHTGAALGAVRPADQVLTAAVDQVRLSQPLTEALADYAKMGAALARHDLAGAGAPYPDARQKLEQAAQLAAAPGIPPTAVQEVKTFTDLVDNYEQMIEAVQNKDAAGVQKYSALVQSGTKAMNAYGAGAFQDWNTRTFAPLVKAYDAGLKSAA